MIPTPNTVKSLAYFQNNINVEVPGVYSLQIGSQLADYVVTAAQLSNTDAADNVVVFAIADLEGGLTIIGSLPVLAPVAPFDETISEAVAGLGTELVSGFVVLRGNSLMARAQVAFTTGQISGNYTVGYN